MMILLCCLLFSGILTIAASGGTNSLNNDKSINVALETAFEFNKKDKVSDLMFLNNVQKLIGEIKTIVMKRENLRRQFEDVKAFEDFIERLLNIINNLNDGGLKWFFTALNDEFKRYNRDYPLNELTDNYDLATYVEEKLDKVENLPPIEIRNIITSLLENIKGKNYGKNGKDLIGFINSLYSPPTSTLNLQNILNELDINQNKGFKKVIQNGLKSLIFDHYKQLDIKTKKALKTVLDHYLTSLTRRKEYNTDFRAINHELKYPDSYEKKSQTNYFQKTFMSSEDYLPYKQIPYNLEHGKIKDEPKMKIIVKNAYNMTVNPKVNPNQIKIQQRATNLEEVFPGQDFEKQSITQNEKHNAETKLDMGYNDKQNNMEHNSYLKLNTNAYDKLTTKHLILNIKSTSEWIQSTTDLNLITGYNGSIYRRRFENNQNFKDSDGTSNEVTTKHRTKYYKNQHHSKKQMINSQIPISDEDSAPFNNQEETSDLSANKLARTSQTRTRTHMLTDNTRTTLPPMEVKPKHFKSVSKFEPDFSQNLKKETEDTNRSKDDKLSQNKDSKEENLLHRVKQLENELQYVKNQLTHEKEVIKDLKSRMWLKKNKTNKYLDSHDHIEDHYDGEHGKRLKAVQGHMNILDIDTHRKQASVMTESNYKSKHFDQNLHKRKHVKQIEPDYEENNESNKGKISKSDNLNDDKYLKTADSISGSFE